MNETSNHSSWLSRLLRPPQIQLEGIRTGAVLTRRMNTCEDGVFTKVVPNHVNRTSNHSNWLSRLLCPPQIQLHSIRTGTVFTKRMTTFEDNVFTKVVPNHVNGTSNQSNWSSRLTCPQGDFKQELKYQVEVSHI